jgi:uncharacterized damage-inducible protein DinB
MNEKDMLLATWEREFHTTLKVLKAYPEQKLDLKPHERSKTARELAWTLASEEPVMINGGITGKFDFENMPKVPATKAEIITAYEEGHREMVAKVRQLTDADFNKTVKFMVAPKTMGDVRSGDIFWTLILDSVHHRGQFSVYLRMAGGKVPSIYGPSADEPWM